MRAPITCGTTAARKAGPAFWPRRVPGEKQPPGFLREVDLARDDAGGDAAVQAVADTEPGAMSFCGMGV